MRTLHSDEISATVVFTRDELLATHTSLNEVVNGIGLQNIKGGDEELLAHGSQLLSALSVAIRYLDTTTDGAEAAADPLVFARASDASMLRVRASILSFRVIASALRAVDRNLEEWEFGIRTGFERTEIRELRALLEQQVLHQ